MIKDIKLEQDSLLDAAENLQFAWGLPHDMDVEKIAEVLGSHIEELLEELTTNPDFFFKDNYKLKKELYGIECKTFSRQADKELHQQLNHYWQQTAGSLAS